jgi:alcohol dehydrogenase (cytochrome c)
MSVSRTAAALLGLLPCSVLAQDVVLDPDVLLDNADTLAGDWPTYSGDYTGRRYSSLSQIDKETVTQLTLAWTVEMNYNVRGGGLSPFGGGSSLVTHVGGEGTGEIDVSGGSIKGSILEVDGMLYVTAPDHVWALDARDGSEIWHYHWETRGGTHIASRGAAIWNDSLFFETPDNYLVSLDARTGEENWHVEIASFEQQYFSTMAPIVVGDTLLVGTGNDLDQPGFLQAFDPATGELLW